MNINNEDGEYISDNDESTSTATENVEESDLHKPLIDK